MSEKGKGGSPSSVGEMTLDAFKELMEGVLSPVRADVERLNKRTGILVEEKARSMVTQMFGSDFSKRFLIKSLHEVVKLISKADDSDLPKEHSSIQRNDAVEKVAAFLEPLVISFVRSAVTSVEKASKDPIFAHEVFTPYKKHIETAKSLAATNEPKVDTVCGLLLSAVKGMGGGKDARGKDLVVVVGESKEQKQQRISAMTGTFKQKLERIKIATDNNGLVDCSGPGIMFCCALTKAPKEDWGIESRLKAWIDGTDLNFEHYRQEVECDIRGSVSLVGSHATISCGEIKTTFTCEAYASAVAQLQLRSSLVEFVLRQIFGERFIMNTIKKGHLFVLEANEDHQNFSHKEEGNLSVFVHRVH
jgi:hypothetical protein